MSAAQFAREPLFDRPRTAVEVRFRVSSAERDAVRREAKRLKIRIHEVILEALALEQRAVAASTPAPPEQRALFVRAVAGSSLSVYLSQEELAWLDDEARRRESTRSDVIVAALRRYFARGEGKGTPKSSA